MTNKGESMTPKGKIGLTHIREPFTIRPIPIFFEGKKDKIIEERDWCLKNGLDGTSYEFISEGIHIWYGNLKLQKKIKVRFENSRPYIHMIFSIRATGMYSVENGGEQIFKFSDLQHNIWLLPATTMFAEIKPSDQAELLSINLSPELFFSYFPDTSPIISEFQKNIEKKMPARMSKQNLPFAPQTNLIVHEIVHCHLHGYSKRLYIEAKIIELLAIQIDQYEQIKGVSAYPVLKTEELEKMYQVQKTILENIELAFSLKELARQVGTNEYNLKKHFKQVFGTTVFGYIKNLKMGKAKEMLSDSEMKIAEISRQLGYKHATHFTVAFKKYFGYLPHKIKA